jgi:thiamine-monophosphate kinase
MAAQPVAALVSLCLPRSGGETLAKQLYAGILSTAARYDVAIAGGDTNSWEGTLAISITALGEVQPGREWRRSGARPGDRILVTGTFGGSILGKHLAVSPRIHEARWLADHAEIHAAIDVSDGLSLDLSRMAEASHCGAVLDLSAIPIAKAADQLAREKNDSVTALTHALSDGEDFELILAVSAGEAERLEREQPLDIPLTDVGHFCNEPGLWGLEIDGICSPLTPRGWEHRLQP